MYLYFDKRKLQTTNRIKSINHANTQKSGASIGVIGRQITTAPVFATGGKPSTWLPPGRLVEQACILWYTYGIDAVVWR